MQQLFKSASWNKKQVDCCIIKTNDPDFEFIFKQRAFHWEREVAVPPDLFPKTTRDYGKSLVSECWNIKHERVVVFVIVTQLFELVLSSRIVFQNLIMEGVESRKNVRKTVEQTMWKLTNKETVFDYALFCCKTQRRRARAWKKCKGQHETQSSVSLYFLSVNPHTNFSIFPSLQSLLALCVRSHHSNLALLSCCFSLSSFWLAKYSPQRLGKACVEEVDLFINVCWDAKF